jgi:AsmA family/AsmA-like C-terminal region
LKFLGCKRKTLGLGALVLSILVLVRPGAGKLQSRVVRSMTVALGRKVDVGSVTLRLFPLPSFELENVRVQEDPAFSAEPMVRSGDVSAALRLSSLLRGRLEISRLSFSEPSLNLVRNTDGHWNLEDLLQRAASVSVGPTASRKLQPRPSFPYIEAKGARINIKLGPEKMPYALSDADFSLWQDSENSWGVRLRAQPFRSDSNLSDTGILRIEGSWLRAQSFEITPVQFRIEWDRAQLGQATKLFWGDDKGWRGAITISAIVAGTPEKLMLDAQSSIQDFHRYDISSDALTLRAHCRGRYSSTDRTVSQLACRTPVKDGFIDVAGTFAAKLASPTYELHVSAQNLPLQSVVEFARHTKKNISDDLQASGSLDANFRLEHALGAAPLWRGEGEATGVHLQSKLASADLTLDHVPFTLSSGTQPATVKRQRRSTDPVSQPHIEIGPLVVATGRSIPAAVRGDIFRAGYDFLVQGEVEIQSLLQVARIAGFSILHPAVTGPARVDLRIEGPWAGFRAPVLTGKVQLHSAQATVRGLRTPLEISSANLLLTPEDVQVQDFAAAVAHSLWRGSVSVPRRCEQAGTCPVRFDIHANEISLAEVNRLLNPGLLKRPWYGFFSSAASSAGSYLGSLYAEGKLSTSHLLFHHLTAERVSAEVELEHGKLRLSNLRGEVLGGKHIGEWNADFTKRPPIYNGRGTLSGIVLEQLAEHMHDGWVTGIASATYEGTASGWTADNLFNSGIGSIEAEIFDGLLPHLRLVGDTDPIHVNHLAGGLVFQDGQFQLKQIKLQTSESTYQVSGTASLKRMLDLRFMREGASGFRVTGTLDQPHVTVTTTPETQAALKP